MEKYKFSKVKTQILYQMSVEQREELRLLLNELHDNPHAEAPDLLREIEELKAQLSFALHIRSLGGQIILNDNLDGPSVQVAKTTDLIKLDHAFSVANNQLTETLTSIKDAAFTLDIPQARQRALDQLTGKDKELDERWDRVRGILLQVREGIPQHIPATIAARKEAVATFVQSNGRTWQPLWKHIRKTAEFGIEDLPKVTPYNSGGKTNGRLWLAEQWQKVADDDPDLGAGGIWNRLKQELDAENLPDGEKGLPDDLKKKVIALRSLNYYGYGRASDLARELRRVTKQNSKLPVSEHVPT